jgi:hypothetical protein
MEEQPASNRPVISDTTVHMREPQSEAAREGKGHDNEHTSDSVEVSSTKIAETPLLADDLEQPVSRASSLLDVISQGDEQGVSDKQLASTTEHVDADANSVTSQVGGEGSLNSATPQAEGRPEDPPLTQTPGSQAASKSPEKGG